MRMGQFSRQVHSYGTALDVVKPRNNNPGSVIPPELLDPDLKLNEKQKQDLASRILDLFNVYRGERDFY
jgi:hypothetical protein